MVGLPKLHDAMKRQWVMLTMFGEYMPKCKCGWRGLATVTYLMAARSCKIHDDRRHSA
jgi:hypothetical protein